MQEHPNVEVKEYGFRESFYKFIPEEILGQVCRYKPNRRGRRPVLTVSQLILGLVFHVMNGAGSLVEHLRLLIGKSWAGSTVAQRRAAVPWKVFLEVMERALGPIADKQKQPQAFYRELRLVAIDGTQFSLSNTAQILRHCTKALARRLRAAFAKMEAVVLLEVGLHNPVAAAIGRELKDKKSKSEWALALGLLAKLPEQSLLLADRLYGCARFLAELMSLWEGQSRHFLVRARSQLKAKVVERLADGSAIIEVPLRSAQDKNKIEKHLRLREIRVRVKRPGFRTQEVRLWTDLMEAAKYPALELVELYTRRWEHELYYRQMKLELRRSELLQSQTVETAAQEVAALILATAILARERAVAGEGGEARKISFIKALQLLQPLWLTLELGKAILNESQKEQLVAVFLEQIRRYALGKKRSRHCPRVVRQPVGKWPRKLKNQSTENPVNYEIIPSQP